MWYVKDKITVGKTVSLLQSCSPLHWASLNQSTTGCRALVREWMRCKAVLCSTKSFFFFFLVEPSCLILLVELTVLSFPRRCCLRVVLIRTLRRERTWQSQSQTPMLCSCLGKGARQKPRRSVQVPGLLVPIQKHILSLRGMHLKKQMAKTHWALQQPSRWKRSIVMSCLRQ